MVHGRCQVYVYFGGKGNVEGTAFSYLLQTVEDVILEDVRLYFLSLQRKRENLYILQALIFDGLQLIPSELEDFKEDIISASNIIRTKYKWKHFKLEFKRIKSLYTPQNGNYGRANVCIRTNFLKKVQFQICNRSVWNFSYRH